MLSSMLHNGSRCAAAAGRRGREHSSRLSSVCRDCQLVHAPELVLLAWQACYAAGALHTACREGTSMSMPSGAWLGSSNAALCVF